MSMTKAVNVGTGSDQILIRSAKTTYEVASDDYSYRRARSFVAAQGLNSSDFEFPTILAIDESDRVVGVLSTDTSQGAIVAGPLVVRADRPRRMTVLRLIEVYDAVMRSCGVKEYLFSTTGQFKAMVEKLGLTPGGELGGETFYKRTLD